jgi:hypothetical protein
MRSERANLHIVSNCSKTSLLKTAAIMAPMLLEMLLKCESKEIKEYIRGRKKKKKRRRNTSVSKQKQFTSLLEKERAGRKQHVIAFMTKWQKIECVNHFLENVSSD